MEHIRDRAEEKASRSEDKVVCSFIKFNEHQVYAGKSTLRGAWNGQ